MPTADSFMFAPIHNIVKPCLGHLLFLENDPQRHCRILGSIRDDQPHSASGQFLDYSLVICLVKTLTA